jgi:phosphohistidine phosphatase
MRTLLLLRHAKSDRDQPVIEDFARPLNARGRAAATRMGAWMKEHHLQPEWVICSPAVRTRETLSLLREHLAIPDTLIDFDDRVYLADSATLLGVLARCPEDMNNVLLIGHNPGIEQLLAHLCGEPLPLSATGKLMPTAALAKIALPDDWHTLPLRAGKLSHIIRPEEFA